MNLISMIFDIDLIIKRMQRNKERKPADINLLFIEEPEAHTHPQMQYVFIKNIKNLFASRNTTQKWHKAKATIHHKFSFFSYRI